jgi:hypothetical protein
MLLNNIGNLGDNNEEGFDDDNYRDIGSQEVEQKPEDPPAEMSSRRKELNELFKGSNVRRRQ